MTKYKVEYFYDAVLTVEVEADSTEEAKEKAREMTYSFADDFASGRLKMYWDKIFVTDMAKYDRYVVLATMKPEDRTKEEMMELLGLAREMREEIR